MMEEIRQRDADAQRIYKGAHVVSWRYGTCVGDSNDIPWLLAHIKELDDQLEAAMRVVRVAADVVTLEDDSDVQDYPLQSSKKMLRVELAFLSSKAKQ